MERVPLCLGNLDVDRGELVREDGSIVRLTLRERDLIRYLWVRKGQVVTRKELLTSVLGYAESASTRCLDMAVARLRSKIEPCPRSPTHLRTAHGDGYSFFPATEPAAHASLTPREVAILSILQSRQGQPIPAEELWREVAPTEAFSPRAVVNAIHRLRTRIDGEISHRAAGYSLAEVKESRPRPLHDLLWSASRHVGELLRVDDCVIYVRDGNALVQAAAFGAKHAGDGEIKNQLILRMGEGIVGAAAARGSTELVFDTRADSRYIDDVYPGLSELCVPIVKNGEVLGVIDTESPAVAAYSEEDARLVESVAQLIASAATDLNRAIGT